MPSPRTSASAARAPSSTDSSGKSSRHGRPLSGLIEAGQLRLESMALKGYREIAVIEARNQREAERQFFVHWLEDRQLSSPAPHAPIRRGPVLRPGSAVPPECRRDRP